jgi:hypothetical protein
MVIVENELKEIIFPKSDLLSKEAGRRSLSICTKTLRNLMQYSLNKNRAIFANSRDDTKSVAYRLLNTKSCYNKTSKDEEIKCPRKLT